MQGKIYNTKSQEFDNVADYFDRPEVTITPPKQTPALETRGERYNEKKPLMSLASPLASEGIASILTFGAKKYDKHNWMKGLPYTEVVDSLLRHVSAFLRGEDTDPESGLLHVDHIQCNAMFLSHFIHTGRTDLDDRANMLNGKLNNE